MKPITKRSVSILLVLILVFCTLPLGASAAGKITTTPTGYDSADDVDYVTVSGTVVNWGARGEDCEFLSTYATQFYTGNYTYDVLSANAGSNYQTQVPSSELYKALQSMMTARHTHQTSYGETRYQYCYTDCVSNNHSEISSFYSGSMFESTWDQGATWNREHIWPASKSLSGRPGNSDRGEGADIMMLRPTLKSENGSRGNTAYGESSGYFDPGVDVRGDCARIALYTYVRWGNDRYMWGKSGVIENLNILLKWMEEDPVDTWEMGRNDSVESITGTRNVFVDYPELAWLLFGKEIPSDMTTPSGIANDGNSGNGGSTACSHNSTEVRNAKAATCTDAGYTGDTYCTACGEKTATGTSIPASGHKNANGDNRCDVCGASVNCSHAETETRNVLEATCSAEGYTGDICCKYCGQVITSGESIPKIAHTEVVVDAVDATCCTGGYTGDTVCSVCNAGLIQGDRIPPTGEHTYGDWVITKEATTTEPGTQERTCTVGGHKETAQIPVIVETPTEPEPDTTEPDTTEPDTTEPTATEPSGPEPAEPSNPLLPIIVTAAAVIAAAVGIFLFLFFKKKKEQPADN